MKHKRQQNKRKDQNILEVLHLVLVLIYDGLMLDETICDKPE